MRNVLWDGGEERGKKVTFFPHSPFEG